MAEMTPAAGAAANRLVAANQGLAYVFANGRRRAAAQVGLEYDDLVQLAFQGLIFASRSFDPARAKFTTWSRWWMRREWLYWRKNQFFQKRSVQFHTGQMSVYPNGRDVEVLDTSIETPPVLAQDGEDLERLAAAIERLEPRLQRIVRARFFEDRTLKDVGAEEDLSRERVRQLEADALVQLRALMAGNEVAA